MNTKRKNSPLTRANFDDLKALVPQNKVQTEEAPVPEETPATEEETIEALEIEQGRPVQEETKEEPPVVQEFVKEEPVVKTQVVKTVAVKEQSVQHEPMEFCIDPYLLKTVGEQTPAMCVNAVMAMPEAIEFVKNPWPLLCAMAIPRAKEAIFKITAPTLDQYKLAAIHHPVLLDRLPQELRPELEQAISDCYKDLGITLESVLSGRIIVPVEPMHSSIAELIC